MARENPSHARGQVQCLPINVHNEEWAFICCLIWSKCVEMLQWKRFAMHGAVQAGWLYWILCCLLLMTQNNLGGIYEMRWFVGLCRLFLLIWNAVLLAAIAMSVVYAVEYVLEYPSLVIAVCHVFLRSISFSSRASNCNNDFITTCEPNVIFKSIHDHRIPRRSAGKLWNRKNAHRFTWFEWICCICVTASPFVCVVPCSRTFKANGWDLIRMCTALCRPSWRAAKSFRFDMLLMELKILYHG